MSCTAQFLYLYALPISFVEFPWNGATTSHKFLYKFLPQIICASNPQAPTSQHFTMHLHAHMHDIAHRCIILHTTWCLGLRLRWYVSIHTLSVSQPPLSHHHTLWCMGLAFESSLRDTRGETPYVPMVMPPLRCSSMTIMPHITGGNPWSHTRHYLVAYQFDLLKKILPKCVYHHVIPCTTTISKHLTEFVCSLAKPVDQWCL